MPTSVSVAASSGSLKINTDFWAKPIPDRRFDWSAAYDDYEGGDGVDEPGGPIGYGTTEMEAINELLEIAPPCKNQCQYTRQDGGCLRCDADAGEACRLWRDHSNGTRTGADRCL